MADLFATAWRHTVIPDFNCIVVRLEPTGQEHEFKVRRSDIKEYFELMKKVLGQAVDDRLQLKKMIESGGQMKPEIGIVRPRPCTDSGRGRVPSQQTDGEADWY